MTKTIEDIYIALREVSLTALLYFGAIWVAAYFIKSFEVDENIGTKEDIQLFINLAHKSGHCVITDFITCFSRYVQPVIENPYLVRWIDIKEPGLL